MSGPRGQAQARADVMAGPFPRPHSAAEAPALETGLAPTEGRGGWTLERVLARFAVGLSEQVFDLYRKATVKKTGFGGDAGQALVKAGSI